KAMDLIGTVNDWSQQLTAHSAKGRNLQRLLGASEAKRDAWHGVNRSASVLAIRDGFSRASVPLKNLIGPSRHQ
ncbi:hypothetical protein, partial [Chitinimonas sp.]|uniref:hypothetical protein n=1 Tax=Chitinimonas sp. TaxID=1934313 RepID=UPI0035B00CC8